MDFIRKVKSQEEKDRLIAEAKKEWDRLDPAISHLVAPSEDHYLAGVSAGIEIEKAPFVPARELTAEELAKQNGELMFMELFGDRANSNKTGIEALDKAWEAKEAAELEKLLGPGRHAKSEFEVMVETAVAEVLAKGRQVPRRASEREGIMPLAKRTSGGSGRIEYDAKIDESTEYGPDGGLLRSWHGAPTHRPGAAA